MTSIAVAAIVCSQGESLTHRIHQMRAINVIAAAVIGASLGSATPVFADFGEADTGSNTSN